MFHFLDYWTMIAFVINKFINQNMGSAASVSEKEEVKVQPANNVQ